MSLANYMNLPYELSGSMSKNRFRNEMLWGLKKVFEVYKTDNDFTIVFDYKCDVEFHMANGKFEFYQLKTQKDNGAYKINKLIKPNKSGDSVLGKLYLLKYGVDEQEQDDVIIALVSNAPFSDGEKVHTDTESLDFLSISNKACTEIKKAITNELARSETINLKNSYFIRTSMDLINPERTLIGELSLFFEEVFYSEAKKINSLYRLLYAEISSKASYELRIDDYKELLKRKGISKDELTLLFRKYYDNTDTAISKAKDYISNKFTDNFKMRVEMNKSLNQVLIQLPGNKIMQKFEQEIVQFIHGNLQNLPNDDFEIVEFVSKSMNFDEVPIEMSLSDMKMLIVVVLKRYEEGMYEKIGN
ncbi:dsDNA nuclease domain-containing protein [Paenibacillus graminis]|uniref:dsDNA nuclease domain-containing protein n=1 Tax=Paenibacillus graminis TaxID=189425 RepID=UPI0004B3187F|nr:dsDNA nuclease domain-containing protein [Paenibacillus graminis]